MKISPNRTQIQKMLIVIILGIVAVALFLLVRTRSKQIEESGTGPDLTGQIDTKIEPISEITEQPIAEINVGTDNRIVGVSRADGKVRVFDGDKQEIIYDRPISNYSFTDPYIVIIEQTNFTKIIIVNVKTSDTQTIDVKEFDQVIAASLDPDLETLYFVGNYDAIKRTASLYKTNKRNFKAIEIADIAALKIEALSNDRLLVYAPADSIDAGNMKIVDSISGKTLVSSSSNGVKVSPLRDSVLSFTEKTVFIIDESNLQIPIKVPQAAVSVTWRNNKSLLMLRNISNEKFGLTYFDTTSRTYSEENVHKNPSTTPLARIEGVTGNTAILRNTQGEFFTFLLTDD